jgi:hypothetical protein
VTQSTTVTAEPSRHLIRRKNMSLTNAQKELAIKEAAKVAAAWAGSAATNRFEPEKIFTLVYKEIEKVLSDD